jgi:hypothetical protein
MSESYFIAMKRIHPEYLRRLTLGRIRIRREEVDECRTAANVAQRAGRLGDAALRHVEADRNEAKLIELMGGTYGFDN